MAAIADGMAATMDGRSFWIDVAVRLDDLRYRAMVRSVPATAYLSRVLRTFGRAPII
jgi:hypothetical protein